MRIMTCVVAVVVCAPLVAAAEDGILASAERLAAEAELQGDVTGMRLSPARFGLGVALAAAGVAMLLVDPEQPVQPTQPGLVSDTALLDGTPTCSTG